MAAANGEVIITNDGATILNKMTVAHPAAKMLVELAKSQVRPKHCMCSNGCGGRICSPHKASTLSSCLVQGSAIRQLALPDERLSSVAVVMQPCKAAAEEGWLLLLAAAALHAAASSMQGCSISHPHPCT